MLNQRVASGPPDGRRAPPGQRKPGRERGQPRSSAARFYRRSGAGCGAVPASCRAIRGRAGLGARGQGRGRLRRTPTPRAARVAPNRAPRSPVGRRRAPPARGLAARNRFRWTQVMPVGASCAGPPGAMPGPATESMRHGRGRQQAPGSAAPDAASAVALPARRRHDVGGDAVGGDAVGHPGRRLAHLVAREMGVARRGLDLAVAQQPADRRQRLAEGQRARGKP